VLTFIQRLNGKWTLHRPRPFPCTLVSNPYPIFVVSFDST
jgi:hypothetical protein